MIELIRNMIAYGFLIAIFSLLYGKKRKKKTRKFYRLYLSETVYGDHFKREKVLYNSFLFF